MTWGLKNLGVNTAALHTKPCGFSCLKCLYKTFSSREVVIQTEKKQNTKQGVRNLKKKARTHTHTQRKEKLHLSLTMQETIVQNISGTWFSILRLYLSVSFRYSSERCWKWGRAEIVLFVWYIVGGQIMQTDLTIRMTTVYFGKSSPKDRLFLIENLTTEGNRKKVKWKVKWKNSGHQRLA